MSDSLITRRRFLQTATVATAATQIAPRLGAEPAEQQVPYPENGTLIPDHGWRLWLDTKVAWEANDIFLPEDVAWVDGSLFGKGKPLPANAPTGGWAMLAATAGIEVMLPTTVEQHFWGKEGSRPYTPEEYRYAPDTKGGTQQPAPPTDVVGDFRAPWMGNWYFVREHAVFAGMPVNQATGGFYQTQGRQSNGLLVEGDGLEVIVGYSRDHDRKVGAGTFTAKLGKGKVLFHRVPEMHPVMQQRFLANALKWLVG